MSDVVSGALGQRAWFVACGLAAGLGLVATLVPSDDPDMFHHLALGREIVRAGLPTTEPFLYPLRGEPQGAPPYWLGSVVIYAWQAGFGDVGLSLLPALVGAALAVLLLIDSKPRSRPHTVATLVAAALPIALAIETYRYRAVARTEIFSAVLLAFSMWAIRRFEEGRARALVLLPVVAVVWTNLHTGMGIVLVPLAVLAMVGGMLGAVRRLGWWTPPGALELRQLGVVLAVLAGTLVAATLNPSSDNAVVASVRYGLSALGLGGAGGAAAGPSQATVLATILEMQGGGVELWRTPVGALIVVAAIGGILAIRSVRLREWVTLALFAVLPFVAIRFAMFFAIVAAPIAARALGEVVVTVPSWFGRFPARAGLAGALVAATLATIPLGRLAPHIRFGTGIRHDAFPQRGADVLQALRFDGRLFNTFDFGGYLEWRSIGPPFQDGRGSVRPEDAVAARAGPTQRALFASLDTRYRFDALLVTYPAGDPASGASLGSYGPEASRWALVAFDDAGLLYLRRDGKYGDVAERDEYKDVAPAHPERALAPARPLAALAEYRRSVVEAPGCFRCRFLLGELALALADPGEAQRAVEPGMDAAVGPDREALASIAERAGAMARAFRARSAPR